MTNNVGTILEGLNPEQSRAVQCIEGPVLIVAGAGSGKTRVLTRRIAYILAQGAARPSEILALTFTKKAAGEMKERIASLVGEDRARWLWMGTFHSIFIRFLREYSDFLGYPKNFTIYDTSDSVSAIKNCIKELQLDDKVYKPKEVLSRISIAKNNLVTASAYAANTNAITRDTQARKPRICDIYALYTKKCKASGVMDFDDILLQMNILLRDNPQALEAIAEHFRYILVDEYQDTNYAQYIILKKLAYAHHNICVVGDDSQSIYAFRGAKIENILNFKKDYPQCSIFRLEENYRSTRTIVSAANSLIAHNTGRIRKECFSTGDKGDKIALVRAFTEQEEALLIAGGIQRILRDSGAQYRDFAVLYRTNAQSRSIEEALRRRNLPYLVYSGNAFFERAEVKDMMAYFKLVVNNNDDEAFRRIVNKPARGIGGTTLAAVSDIASAQGVSLFQAALQHPKLKAFTDMILTLSALAQTMEGQELAIKIAEVSGLYAYYKSDTSIEGLSRTANVEELLNSVAQYAEELEEGEPCRLDMYLENVSLLSNVDVSDDEDGANKIALMTVHSAKGLEFPYVFIAGLEENLFPSGGMMASPSDIEEERRLFYVAITRAKKNVSLSYADTRMRNGRHESNPVSRFVREIDDIYLDHPLPKERMEQQRPFSFTPRAERPAERPAERFAPRDVTAVRRPAVQTKPEIIDPDFVPSPISELKVGRRVEHNRFGPGLITEITGSFPDLKAKISFDEYGEKYIMLKYAKLRIEK
ncbi:MAG: UvrD-helicase domain-containing protein [Bacteroidales bacterium]|nr:UvrD-helicase domain-containing protein [Bacteroidales bacterium]MBQ2104711.1 UvrD-helicase domain-containing protein [Bacteroidales bacterium]